MNSQGWEKERGKRRKWGNEEIEEWTDAVRSQLDLEMFQCFFYFDYFDYMYFLYGPFFNLDLFNWIHFDG
jgi:hypothetical protein